MTRILPDRPLAEMMHRTYEVAVPPRPAHIAAGIAAGIFNGSRIEPDDPNSTLPALLIKGVFDREWRTVEEKHDKKGNKTAEVQVQQPKLIISILDLREHVYYTLASTTAKSTGPVTDVATLGIADLLDYYGKSMMTVMERQCVILYDPRRPEDVAAYVASSPRVPFVAHKHTIRACVKNYETHPEAAVFLAGEIGSGKSACALLIAKTMRKRRPLVVCPPHLLQTWTNEVMATTPEAEVRVLSSISDVDALRVLDPEDRVVAILSRETAKLGHAWEGVTGIGNGYALWDARVFGTSAPTDRSSGVGGTCPKCGQPTPRSTDFAKKRSRCTAQTRTPANNFAQLAVELAMQLRAHTAGRIDVQETIGANLDKDRLVDRISAVWSKFKKTEKPEPTKYAGIPADLAVRIHVAIMNETVKQISATNRAHDAVERAILWSYATTPDDNRLAMTIPLTYYKNDYDHFAHGLAALLPKAQGNAVAETLPGEKEYDGRITSSASILSDWRGHLAKPTAGQNKLGGVEVRRDVDKDQWIFDGDSPAGSLNAAIHLLVALKRLAHWHTSEACGEMLFQAIPEPRRFPLAKYIAKRGRGLFDFLILDEVHELSVSQDSAQSIAAHRLVNVLGVPVLMMTGSILNGYAKSVFKNMESASPLFREEFERGAETAFVERYGYKKRVVQDKSEGEVVAFGSNTDRVERCYRDAGDAPGILPLFLFRHLLPRAVTLHKSDLRIDLPVLTQDRAVIEADGELQSEYSKLLRTVLNQIKQDRFRPDVAGKLFGALADLGSYLDRAIMGVGNVEGSDRYEVRYPEGVPEVGGDLVASAKLFPTNTILPKEAAMLDFVESELKADRRVMVLVWHVNLLPRLQMLLEKRLGEKCPVLYADKVPTAKRQAWIDKEVVAKGARVLICNPICIQTGLNNLVWFCSQWDHENPACNAIVDRQKVGRIDRIGQTKPTLVKRAYYGKHAPGEDVRIS